MKRTVRICAACCMLLLLASDCTFPTTSLLMVKRMQTQQTKCPTNSIARLNNSSALWLQRAVFTVAECFSLCFQQNGEQRGEVCQLTRTTGVGVWSCVCFSIPALYLVLFPRRYIDWEATSDSPQNDAIVLSHIHYRSDRLVRDDGIPISLFEKTMPLLFYALDSTSGTLNLGSLDAENYAAQWRNGSGHYDCEWSPGRTNKLLRLEPAEIPWLHMGQNLTDEISTGFTWLLWFKKRNPAGFSMPMLDCTTSRYQFHFWNFPDSRNFHWYACDAYNSLSDVFDQNAWNHATVSVTSNYSAAWINGTYIGYIPCNGNSFRMDFVNFGVRRAHGDYWDNRVWDGCSAHAMLFNSSLSRGAAMEWMSLVRDEEF